MANRSKRPCRHPGCPALVVSGYCDKHKQQKERYRGSANERGYNRDWQKARDRFLRDNPCCAKCLEKDRAVPATVVHHIKPISQGGEILDPDNFMSLCRDCHERLHGRKK
jgi:5-methylcytosine-specific restriction protein A